MIMILNVDFAEPVPYQGQSAEDNDPELVDPAADRALYVPLPSSEVFPACIVGARLVVGGDILDPAFDLVACLQQKRLAERVLTSDTASLDG